MWVFCLAAIGALEAFMADNAIPKYIVLKMRRPKLILINSKLGRPGGIGNCTVPCRISYDASDLQNADAVVWNARFMEPIANVPANKRPGQKWIFNFYFEAPVYQGRQIARPVVDKLAPNIDWTLTYKNESDFLQPWQLFERARNRTFSFIRSSAAGKTKILLWFASKCDNHVRFQFVRGLKDLQYCRPGL